MAKGIGVRGGDDMNLRLLSELMFYCADFRMRRGFQQIIHPAVGKQRRRRNTGVRSAGMPVRVVLGKRGPDFFQQIPRTGVILEMRDSLPSDV